MLDDDAGRLNERLDALPRGVAVRDIVVREFLALQLSIGGDRSRRRRLVAIERGGLMRILAVAHLLRLVAGKMKRIGKAKDRAIGAARGEPVCDRAIVGGCMRERLAHQAKARRSAERAAVRIQFGQHPA